MEREDRFMGQSLMRQCVSLGQCGEGLAGLKEEFEVGKGHVWLFMFIQRKIGEGVREGKEEVNLQI